jgi:ribonuclease BN (tRNA processing enzyme)
MTTHTDRWRLDLVLLGIGGAFDADRGCANTNALLELHRPGARPWRVLLDCGHTCGRQLGQLGLGYDDIDETIITHAHGDHIDGLEVFGYKSLFLHQRRPSLRAEGRVLEQIWASLRPKMGTLQRGPGESVQVGLDTYFDPSPLGEEPFALAEGALEARLFAVPHVAGMPCFGVMLGVPGGRALVRWSGDTTFQADSPLFAALDAERPERIFHDCLFYPYYPGTVHTHADELMALSSDLRQRVVLIHHGQSAREEDLGGMVLGQALDRFSFFAD